MDDENKVVEVNEVIQPKKSNKNVIIAAIAVVVVAVGAFAATKLYASPLNKVLDAFAATAQNSSKTLSPMEEATGIISTIQNTYSDSATVNTQATLIKAPNTIDPQDEMAGLGFSLKYDKDMEQKQLYADLGVTLDTAKVLNLEVFGNENNLSFSIPTIINGYFTMPTTNIGAAYKASIFNEYQPADIPDDYSIALFGEPENSYLQAVITKQANWLNRLKKDITVEKADKAVLGEGENSKECQGYKISITDEKANALLQDYIAFWETDPDAVGLINEEVVNKAASQSYYVGKNQKDIENEMKESITEAFEDLKQSTLTNVWLMCYVDTSNIIRNIILSADNEIEIDIKLAGKDRALDDITMDLYLQDEDEEYSIYFNNKQIKDADIIVSEGNFNIDDSYGDGIYTQWNMQYNTNDTSLTFNADLDFSDLGSYGINSQGIITASNKGSDFNIVLDNIDIVDLASKEKLSVAGSFSANKLSEPIKQPSGMEYKLFELNENQMTTIMYEAYLNGMKLVSQFGDIFS